MAGPVDRPGFGGEAGVGEGDASGAGGADGDCVGEAEGESVGDCVGEAEGERVGKDASTCSPASTGAAPAPRRAIVIAVSPESHSDLEFRGTVPLTVEALVIRPIPMEGSRGGAGRRSPSVGSTDGRAVRRIGVEERRARLGLRHRLARPAVSDEEVAAEMVGLHSSDPATVFLSARARSAGFVPADLEASLYERRSLVRMLGMRRTLFVVPRDLAAVMDEACTKSLAPGERRRLVQMLEDQGIARPGKAERWLDGVAARTLEALAARGEATARELTKYVPDLGAKLSFGEGKTWAGTVGVSTRVLFLLASEGRIVRTRPLGGWTSGQYRWATTEVWLGGPLPRVDHAKACADLLGRWLRAFGPATSMDIRWWTGWTARLAAKTLESVGAVEVELDTGVGHVLPGDDKKVGGVGAWVALLPALDPTVMGWKERGWYLGDHATELFDRNGNAGPTVWASGRVVGGWTQTGDGDVVVELLEDVDARARKRIDAERERLRAWLGDVRIKPRFPTPLEKRLARS
jgi:hypothetical protein